jgi:GTPase SAR1 family protein
MFENLKKQLTADKPQTKVIQSNAVIRVIGDRASGKTTYMASLARWPNANPNSPVQAVTAVNEESEELIAKAQNLLEQGLQLEPSALSADAANVKDYSLSIILKNQFSLRHSRSHSSGAPIQLNISCKDYAGEFFSDLLHQSSNHRLTSYLEDCLQATGILFLVDGSIRKDADYAIGLAKFLKAIYQTEAASELRRIALVMTKCKQPDLWDKRLKPQQLAQARFPQVYTKLQAWKPRNANCTEFFCTSAFGTVGSKFQEANARNLSRNQGGVTSVLKDSKHWRPFGLVAPIYWICTGEHHRKLDED